ELLREAVPAMHGSDLDAAVAVAQNLGLEGPGVGIRLAEELADRRRGRGALVEDLRLGEEADHLVAELRLQRVGPSLVLLQAAIEALPARLGQLALGPVGVADVDLLELVAQ